MNKKTKTFHRLSTKFICGVAAILVLILTATLLINTRIAGRYYLNRQVNDVRKAGGRLEMYLASGMSPDDAIFSLEETEKVLVVYEADTSDYDVLSDSLREKFRQKGLGFQKFWLWDQDYNSAVQKGQTFRLYRQEKLNYAIIVEYISRDSNLYAVAAIVPDTAGFIGIINQFSVVLYAISLTAAILLIYLLVKHITNPLKQMEEFSRNISRQKYGTLEIRTNDELEHMAESMNQMSTAIQQYQRMLQSKNDQMKHLLNDVAHDLKTPISLIGTYAGGIRDGLDDGTFLDTIIRQNEKMSQMTERLLSLSRIEQKEHPLTRMELDKLLVQCLEEQKLFLRERNLEIQEQIEPHAEIMANGELVAELLGNLISNAVKYASAGVISVSLTGMGEQWCFRIANEFQNEDLDIGQIWEPFYVGEASRNKALSGTGLGLPIAKKIAGQFGYPIRCIQENSVITFEVLFNRI